MTNGQFERYYPKYASVIEAIARKYAGPDTDLFDDLKAEGMKGLLDADLRRPFRNEDAFLRNVIRNKIIDHLRWLDPERFDRLDKHLAQGAQIMADEDTGEPALIRPDRQTRERRTGDMANRVRGRSAFSQLPDEDYDG